MNSMTQMSLKDMRSQAPSVLDALPAEVLMHLQSEAEAHAADAAQMLAILHGVLERKYADGLTNTGTHHRYDGDVEITITVPKRVDWDQVEIGKAVETIKNWGEDPAEYVDTKFSVKEAAYNNWPSAIRDLFTPARTVKAGKKGFKLLAKKQEAA